MSRIASRCCPIFAVALTVACSAGGTSGPVDAGTVTQANFGTLVIGAVCDFEVRCGYYSMTDPATCPALAGPMLSAPVLDHVGGLIKAVDSGRVQIDTAKATACLDAIANAPCQAVTPRFPDLRDFPGCDAVVSNPLADGATCWANEECDPSSICVPPFKAVPLDGGMPPPDGGSPDGGSGTGLDDGGMLTDGGSLDLDAGTPTCLSGVCLKIGDGCRDDLDCTDGKVCDSHKCEIPLVAVSTAGMGCGGAVHCELGLTCVHSESMNHCDVPSTNGGPCGTNGECGPGNVCMNFQSSQTCQPIPAPGLENAPCVQSGDSLTSPACAPGLVCVPSDDLRIQICKKPKKQGDNCTDAYDCGGLESTLICNESTGVCVPRPGIGARCPAPVAGACALPGAYCDALTNPPICKAAKAAGAPCQSDEECGIPGGFCSPSAHICRSIFTAPVCMQ